MDKVFDYLLRGENICRVIAIAILLRAGVRHLLFVPIVNCHVARYLAQIINTFYDSKCLEVENKSENTGH